VKLVKDLLPTLFNDLPSWKIKLLSLWPTIMGQISENVVLEAIEGNTIIIAVKSSAWLHEINCLRTVIIEKINSALAGNYISVIRFKNKNITVKRVHVQMKRKKSTSHHQLILSRSQENALHNIGDEELKELLKRFLLRCINETN
jgi:hypothetical protein